MNNREWRGKAWRSFVYVTSHPIAVRAMQTACVLLVAGSLAACSVPSATSGQLPTVPADIQACFRQGPVPITKAALSVAEVESLWKEDRVRSVVLRQCGERFLAWYGDLQKRWR